MRAHPRLVHIGSGHHHGAQTRVARNAAPRAWSLAPAACTSTNRARTSDGHVRNFAIVNSILSPESTCPRIRGHSTGKLSRSSIRLLSASQRPHFMRAGPIQQATGECSLTTKFGRVHALLAFCIALFGCDRSPPATQSATPGSELAGGNTLYAAGDYAGALAHYRAAAEADTANAAAWFGVHMAGGALGDSALAAAALARAHRLAPEAGFMAHPDPLPAGHPPIESVRPAPDEH
jgi:hypothetical protein